MKGICTFLIALLYGFNCIAQEILFADYFDIKINQSTGSPVFGKVNLKRNKDVDRNPIPIDYEFVIENGGSSIFSIETKFDSEGRIFGEIRVASGQNTESNPTDHTLTILLKRDVATLATKDIVIHVVNETMWEILTRHYTPITISESRLYGRTKKSDSEILELLNELEASGGKFSFSSMYDKHPSEYGSASELENDWVNVSNHIGALGYAYANSSTYGLPSNNLTNIERLKRVIYKAVIQYTKNVPIEGDDVLVNGQPIGSEMGDGFANLYEHKYLSHNFVTHQWRPIDALGAPLVHVWPEVLKDIENDDAEAKTLYAAVIRFYQLFMAEVNHYRAMDDFDERWKDISDLNYSEGAWADANIHHRMRTLMVMPILWADYNRPITYVPYWYDDYYDGTEHEGLTFAHDWTPSGVVSDVRNWSNKLSLPSHFYGQSGFHPDGTVSHHLSDGSSDAAMFAYGFEWLTEVNESIHFFKNTIYPLTSDHFQFITDRLNYSYRRMIYKNSLDFVVTGRSFFSGELSIFGTKHMNRTIDKLIDGKSSSIVIEGETDLLELQDDLNSLSHKHTETTAFWNADYLVHRKEQGDENYFFSVKHKSTRTSGAEDFSSIRKSWHAGSGVFQLRVDGDEYTPGVLERWDWHVLPGVTEEWRIDPLPTGPAYASLPGANKFSGIVADGMYGLTGYHHNPKDSYTSAEALKSYYLVGRFGTALGSNVKRKSSSTSSGVIVTCIDQTKLTNAITYSIDGAMNAVGAGQSVDIIENLTSPTWIHHDNKGYLIFPQSGQKLYIKSGTNVNITETSLGISDSENYILAVDHGSDPGSSEKDGYHYVLVANATLGEMQDLLNSYVQNTTSYLSEDTCHALYNRKEKLAQAVFYKPGRATLSNQWIETDQPATIMVEEQGDQIRLSITDALHNLNSDEITLQIPQLLKNGSYSYDFPGIAPREGEIVTVTNNNQRSTVIISLPNIGDDKLYNYQEQMYAGAPVVINLPCADVVDSPVTDFSANRLNISAGENVVFTDESSNGPKSWSWNFPGGSPSTSNDRNPVVKYDEVGIYEVKLTTSNTLGSNEKTKVNYITVLDGVTTFIGNKIEKVDGVRIYPIPLTNYSIAETTDGSYIRSIDVFDVTGKKIISKSYTGDSSKVDLPRFVKYPNMNIMYIYTVRTTNGLSIIKGF